MHNPFARYAEEKMRYVLFTFQKQMPVKKQNKIHRKQKQCRAPVFNHLKRKPETQNLIFITKYHFLIGGML